MYIEARDALRGGGVTAAELEARLFVSAASGKTRAEYIRDAPLPAPEATAAAASDMTRRRLAGEPAAYITGEWEFYSMPVRVSRETLIPRTDTELLAERAIARLLARDYGGRRVLDLCAGTGCVGLAVVKNAPGAYAVLADKFDGALALCRENAERNLLSNRVSVASADALAAPVDNNLSGGCNYAGSFDIIVCNPPYIPSGDLSALDVSVRDYEPRYALDGGADGLGFFRAVAEKWSSALKRGGYLMFECGAGQSGAVRDILRENGFEDISSARDTIGHERVIEGKIK
ncbi:MAG: peptide chain release factor N(5)-glutamine methyltransferase [Oscillospiraceae bacterium]|nr:peptide chain release factor N(5)-glutamine methyltransferase [Oscillospiraceae bacterium]